MKKKQEPIFEACVGRDKTISMSSRCDTSQNNQYLTADAMPTPSSPHFQMLALRLWDFWGLCLADRPNASFLELATTIAYPGTCLLAMIEACAVSTPAESKSVEAVGEFQEEFPSLLFIARTA